MSERMPMETMERSAEYLVRAAVPEEETVWLTETKPDEMPPWEEVPGNPLLDAGEEHGREKPPDETPPWEELPENPLPDAGGEHVLEVPPDETPPWEELPGNPVPDAGEEPGRDAPPGMDKPDANPFPNPTAPSPPAESTDCVRSAPRGESPEPDHATPPGESTASPEPDPPPDPADTSAPPAAGPLLTGYSHQKRLPLQFLKGLGLGEDGRAVQIPYYDARGRLAALRLRHPPGADPRFSWQPGARPLPYGLWLAQNRLAKALVLVEGESDAHTLWLLGFPALGIPGSCAFQAEWPALLQDRPLHIHQGNDAGGAAFLRHTLHALRRGGHTGPVYVFAASQADARCKDLSDLWLHNMPLAPQVIGALIKGARPCAPGAPGTEPGPAAPATACERDNALSPSGGVDAAVEVGNGDAAKAADGAAGRDSGAHGVADMPGTRNPGAAQHAGNAADGQGSAAYAVPGEGPKSAATSVGQDGRHDNVADIPGAGSPTDTPPTMAAADAVSSRAGNAADGQGGAAYAVPGEGPQSAAVSAGQHGMHDNDADIPGAGSPTDTSPTMAAAGAVSSRAGNPADNQPATPAALHPGLSALPQDSASSPTPHDPFDAYAASSLWGRELQTPPMIWQGRLTAGLCLLAGAPKKGKSWMALALGIAVAQGSPFLGCATHRGEVLYLDLESRAHRVQERLHTLCQGPAPAGLYIAHQAQRMEEGLLPALTSWHAQHPKASLIIVDTLARVKCPGRAGENVYEADTRLLGNLQRFALDKGLCVLLVHHLRKSAGFRERDVYERVSGSMGITGACDCVLVLDGARQEAEARLQLDGRDIPPAQLALRFEGGRWTLLSNDADRWEDQRAYLDSPLPGALKALMQGRERWEGTATQLLHALRKVRPGVEELEPRGLAGELRALSDRILEEQGVVVEHLKSHGKRVFRLSKQADAA